MSKKLISILLLFLAISLFGEDVKKKVERGDPEKEKSTIVGVETKDKKASKKYGVTVGLSSILGQGTFISNEFSDNPLFMQSIVVSPSYSDWGMNFGMMVSASMEYTDSDSTTHANQVLFSDLVLSASRGIYEFKDLGLSFNGSFSLKLPTSLVSQMATLLFAPTFSLSASKSLEDFSLSYGISFSKNFNRYTSPTISDSDLGGLEEYHRGSSSAEYLEDGLVAIGRNNVSFSLSHSIALSYSISDKISASMSFAYSQAWVYNSYEKDEFTSENADSGRAYRDIIIGGLNINWQINDKIGLSFGTSTAQLPKTGDQKGFRFPWYNFSTPADNLSSFFLDINMTF